MAVVTMKALLESGVHFGHRTRRWNPKMKPYIFTERNGIHIVDLQQTIKAIQKAYDLIRDTVANEGTVLFVGTKPQAHNSVVEECERVGIPYVTTRWLGGTLTNWNTIRKRIDTLLSLEARRDRGEFEVLIKKEALGLEKLITKLNLRLGGIKAMRDLPELLFVIDICREETAVREANILGIPVIGMVDTNCDPDPIDLIVPSNDDAIRAIKLMVKTFAAAIEEGIAMRKMVVDEDTGELIESDEQFLGEATLAKLRAGELEFEEDAADSTDAQTAAAASESEPVAESEPAVEPKPADESEAVSESEETEASGD